MGGNFDTFVTFMRGILCVRFQRKEFRQHLVRAHANIKCDVQLNVLVISELMYITGMLLLKM